MAKKEPLVCKTCGTQITIIILIPTEYRQHKEQRNEENIYDQLYENIEPELDNITKIKASVLYHLIYKIKKNQKKRKSKYEYFYQKCKIK